jgi:hypothetical protein
MRSAPGVSRSGSEACDSRVSAAPVQLAAPLHRDCWLVLSAVPVVPIMPIFRISLGLPLPMPMNAAPMVRALAVPLGGKATVGRSLAIYLKANDCRMPSAEIEMHALPARSHA